MAKIIPPAFDSLVLAAVAQEIRQDLLDGRITGLVQPDAHTIGLRLRTRRRTTGLVCSIHPQWARCVIAPLPEGRAVHPFAVQLRARLNGGRLRAALVEPFERVLTLTCETLEGDVHLVLEVMGRHSNLLLVEGERVAGAFKTVTPAMSRVRPIAVGRRYTRPPRTRPTPAEVDAASFASWLVEGRAVGEVLVTHLLGVSPPLAAHLALRAGLDPEQPAPPQAAEALLAGMRELAAVAGGGSFAPVWYEDADGRPAAYAAIPLLTYQALAERAATSMSEAAVRVIETAAREAALGEQRHTLLARISDGMHRAERAAAEVEQQLAAAAEADRWRRFGELLLAYGSAATPGAAEITVPDFDGTPTTIPLDPHHSAVANAQAYFRRHGKAAAARRALPGRIETLRQERAYLDQMRVLAAQATTQEELWTLRRELGEAGVLRRRADRRARPAGAPAPRVFTTATGFRIVVGRTGRENDHVTFSVAAPDDLWLHARGVPGAHVILKTDGRIPSPADVETAAAVAAYYSGGRGASSVPVDVTARRHVRKPKGAEPGMVIYREERTLLVAPRLPEAAAADETLRRGSREWDR